MRTDCHVGIRMIAEGLNMDKKMANKFEHKSCVTKWSQRVHWFLAGKQIPMLEHVP